MLDQLMNLIKENSQATIVNNAEVPDEHNEDVMREAATSITDGLQEELAHGNFKEVVKTVSGKDGTSVIDKIKNIFMNNIMKKFGLSGSAASGIAASVIPLVMNKLAHKTNDPNDSNFSLESIFNSLTGGKMSGMDLGGILNKVKGALDGNNDGSTDLNDITGMFRNAAKDEQKGEGGIPGIVKGLFDGK